MKNSPDHFIILSRFDEEDEDIDNSIGLMTHLSDIEAINSLEKITLERPLPLLAFYIDKESDFKPVIGELPDYDANNIQIQPIVH